MKVMYEGRLVEAVDMTPSWRAVLPMMLDLYAQFKAKKRLTAIQETSMKGLIEEFEKMAVAADKFNEQVKNKKGK